MIGLWLVNYFGEKNSFKYLLLTILSTSKRKKEITTFIAFKSRMRLMRKIIYKALNAHSKQSREIHSNIENTVI